MRVPLPTLTPFELPPGMGFSAIPRDRWSLGSSEDDPLNPLFGRLQVFEAPRKMGARYVMAVDVGEGVGKDRSVVEILRVGSIKEPHEEVAQFVSDDIDAIDLAYYIDAIGQLYKDEDGYEALAAIEINGPGLATQSMLQRHLGYSHFYIWQLEGAAEYRGRFTRAIGWRTLNKTRKYMLTYLIKSLESYFQKDAEGNAVSPDIVINSPITRAEMPEFQTDGERWMAAAADGAHDDCLMALGIGVYVAQTLFDEENEPLNEARRRIAEQQLIRQTEAQKLGNRRDYANTEFTVEEMKEGEVRGNEWFERDDAWGN